MLHPIWFCWHVKYAQRWRSFKKYNAMGKVLIHLTMSLDGFIAKPDEDDWDWIFKYETDNSDDMGNRIMQELGAVVLGNKDFRNDKVQG